MKIINLEYDMEEKNFSMEISTSFHLGKTKTICIDGTMGCSWSDTDKHSIYLTCDVENVFIGDIESSLPQDCKLFQHYADESMVFADFIADDFFEKRI